MVSRDPVAFLSYVHSDDDHDDSRISNYRRRLEGEVKMQTGSSFDIFQDRNDLLWGQHWEQRIKGTLGEISFLIPVITPSFFLSPACRSEMETFLKIEQALGVNKLILPLYYVSCDQIENPADHPDDIANILRSRQWEDWRPFRFKEFSQPDVREAFARMATGIKSSIKELRSVEVASEKRQVNPPEPAIQAETDSIEFRETPEIPIPTVLDSGKVVAENSSRPYRIFTAQYDEVISAGELAGDSAEFLKLQRAMTRTVSVLEKANSGFLARLSRARVDRKKNLAVTVLLDNSGSLRGDQIKFIAAWSVLLMKWFERLEIKSEFLGYTTRAWKGGRSREVWLALGKPTRPGRLNDLRHIVYKSFDDDVSVSTANCAVMMRPFVCKENIDGEALLWAYDRLRRVDADEKMLFVISDGAPVDDSTLHENEDTILTDHLKSVARWIEVQGDISLHAIGLEYNLSGYYSDNVKTETSNVGIPVLRTVAAEITLATG